MSADLQPIFQEDDTIIHNDLLERRRHLQKPLGLFVGAKAHHPLDPGPVVPAAIEDHDLSSRGKMRDVALRVHLRLLPFGRCGKRDDPEDARGYPLCHRLDRAALAGAVASLKENADLQTLVDHPLLELDELDM